MIINKLKTIKLLSTTFLLNSSGNESFDHLNKQTAYAKVSQALKSCVHGILLKKILLCTVDQQIFIYSNKIYNDYSFNCLY